MVEHCSSPYVFLALTVIVALIIGLGLWEQLRVRLREANDDDRQGTRLLLALLAVALISIVIFAIYVADPQPGCL